MTFTESFRMERVYFEKLKNNITDIKNLLAAGNTEDARILLENSVDVDGAVLLLYRNLGECWAELADQIKKTRDELDALKEATEAYHDELNEKIDNVNFVLLRLINALDARLTVVENDLATMPRVKFLSLVYDENESAYSIQNADGETVSFEDVSAMAEFPHFILLTDADGNYYIPKESTESGFVWHIDNYNTTVDAYSDISVVLASDDSVTVSESTLPKISAGYGIEINSDEEIEVDTTTIQEKLTDGFGIEIDSNNEISVDTNDVQEKLIAGQNITLTPDATDPTKTVIDAVGGSSYSAERGITISNDVVSQTVLKHGTQSRLGTCNSVTLFYNLYNYMNQGTSNTLFTLPASVVNDIIDNLKGLYINCLIYGGSATTRPIIDNANKSAEIKAICLFNFYQNNVLKLGVYTDGFYAFYGRTGASIVTPLYNKYIYDIWKYLDKDVACDCKLSFEGYPTIESVHYDKTDMQSYWTGLNGTYKFGGTNAGYGTLQ